MNSEARLRLWGVVLEHAGGDSVTIEHVCGAMASECGVDGAAVTVTLATIGRETLYTSDETAAGLAEMAMTLGEGPSVDAGAGGPALAANLADAESMGRWPMFAPAAVRVGAYAVFAVPPQ